MQHGKLKKLGIKFDPEQPSFKYIFFHIKDLFRGEPPYLQYKSPPVWQHIIGGVVSASVSFFVVLFGLRGTIRLFAWIVQGFKDEKKDEASELDQDQTLEHINQKGDKTS